MQQFRLGFWGERGGPNCGGRFAPRARGGAHRPSIDFAAWSAARRRGVGGGGIGREGAEGGKRGTDTEKAVAPDGREGGERLRVKAILQTESKVPNSLQYFLTFVGRFAMIAANNTTNKEKFAV